MTLKWSEKKKAWLDPQTGQWVKAPAPAPAPTPVVEAAPVAPLHHNPQTLTEAPSAEYELTDEEVKHYYESEIDPHNSEEL